MKKLLLLPILLVALSACGLFHNYPDDLTDSPILGTWASYLNTNWLYQFYPDGTGYRGVNQAQSLTWATRGNFLYIEVDEILCDLCTHTWSRWYITLEGDLLQFSSRDNPNSVYLFTRV